MAALVSLESDRSFVSYEDALAHVTGPPLGETTDLVWNQAMLDVLFDYPIHSDRAAYSIHPALGRLGIRVITVLRFLPPGGAVRAFSNSRATPAWSAWTRVGSKPPPDSS